MALTACSLIRETARDSSTACGGSRKTRRCGMNLGGEPARPAQITPGIEMRLEFLIGSSRSLTEDGWLLFLQEEDWANGQKGQAGQMGRKFCLGESIKNGGGSTLYT